MERIGFKEWALVCEALGRGDQSIILRKGGIAEGRAGFAFQHHEFFLFPTFFHEQLEKVRRAEEGLPPQREGEIEIRYFAKLEFAALVRDWEMAVALEPFHILQREVVRERFAYEGAKGIHVGLVRVFRLCEPWIFPDAPRYGGCRSWLQLPEPAGAISMDPVLPEAKHRARTEELKQLLSADLNALS